MTEEMKMIKDLEITILLLDGLGYAVAAIYYLKIEDTEYALKNLEPAVRMLNAHLEGHTPKSQAKLKYILDLAEGVIHVRLAKKSLEKGDLKCAIADLMYGTRLIRHHLEKINTARLKADPTLKCENHLTECIHRPDHNYCTHA